ncbi:hypothetical protein [Streptomyces sp. NPDC001594]|uniref:hypothetical protein n=1 Tax=Streptomyces sp. NPDC001594 TaxID=3364590 RepID=UPI0036A79781
MLAEPRRHVPPTVRTVRAAFEELRPGERNDTVYAAEALHWTRPDGSPAWPPCCGRGGVFACFGGPVHLADPDVEETVRAARAAFPGERRGPHPGRRTRRVRRSRPRLLGHLSPVSAYLMLPATEQERVFERIARMVPPTVGIVADITVHLARLHGPVPGPHGP